MAQKLVGVTVSWCLFWSFGAKNAKSAQKCKNDKKRTFGAKRWLLRKKMELCTFSHFGWFWPPRPPFGLTIVRFRAKWRAHAFFGKCKRAIWTLKKINDMKFRFHNISIFCKNSKKNTFGFLSYLRVWRVHREARGAQGALWSKKCTFGVLERKGALFAKIN